MLSKPRLHLKSLQSSHPMTRSSRKRRDSEKVDVNEIEKDYLREAEVYQEQYGKSTEQRFQFVILFD